MSESHRQGANQNFSEALDYARCTLLASNETARWHRLPLRAI